MSPTVEQLVSDGAMFFVSHSGGKDSQAMYAHVRTMVPDAQITVVHADLGEVEWNGVQDHIRMNIEHNLNVVRGVWKDGSTKDLLDMIERRFTTRPDVPSFPSSASRYCTSDLKRDPIFKLIRQSKQKICVNCTGIRAEESKARAKKNPFDINKRLTNSARLAYDWMPIFDWSTREVFEYISLIKQEPFWAYKNGNERLSCVFCILASDNDLQRGYEERPELYEKYIKMERLTGCTMFHKASLSDRVKSIPLRNIA